MNPLLLFAIIIFYFSLLMVICYLASRHIRDTTFFDEDKASMWFLVAFGMTGSKQFIVSGIIDPLLLKDNFNSM